MFVGSIFFVVVMPARSSGSSGVWVDPASVHEWVDPTSVLADPLEDTSVHEGSLGPQAFGGDAHLFDLNQYFRDCWDGDVWLGPPMGEATSVAEASDEMANLLLGKYNSGKWYATDICKLAWWGKCIGGVGALAELAKRPRLPTRHYNDHIKRALGTSS